MGVDLRPHHGRLQLRQDLNVLQWRPFNVMTLGPS